jgi:hypothetical protein
LVVTDLRSRTAEKKDLREISENEPNVRRETGKE